jgi:hypothetical protein
MFDLAEVIDWENYDHRRSFLKGGKMSRSELKEVYSEKNTLGIDDVSRTIKCNSINIKVGQ